MNKLPIIISLYFCASNLLAQNIEIVGASNGNYYYDFTKDEGHHITRYEAKNGFAFSLSAEDTLFKSFYTKVVLALHFTCQVGKLLSGLVSWKNGE